jgi:uncharacterized RDD family membrane protein YckC
MLDRPFAVRTPENVEFVWREAGVWSRFLAWAVDSALMGGILAAGLVVLTLAAGLTLGLLSPLLYVYLFAVSSGYFIWCEWKMGGTTPGKRLFHLRTMREDGLRLGFLENVARNLLRAVDSLPGLYGVAALSAAIGQDRRRLGDRVAGTIVVVEPQPRSPATLATEQASPLAADPTVRERMRRLTTAEERDVLVSALLRREELRDQARVLVFRALALHFTRRTGIERPEHLSEERFVLDLAAAWFA